MKTKQNQIISLRGPGVDINENSKQLPFYILITKECVLGMEQWLLSGLHSNQMGRHLELMMAYMNLDGTINMPALMSCLLSKDYLAGNVSFIESYKPNVDSLICFLLEHHRLHMLNWHQVPLQRFFFLVGIPEGGRNYNPVKFRWDGLEFYTRTSQRSPGIMNIWYRCPRTTPLIT